MSQRLEHINLAKDHPMLALLSEVKQQMGFDLNDGMLMARQPAVAKAFAQLTKATLISGSINPSFKRLLGLITSSAAGCKYCISHTNYSAQKMGESLERIEALWTFEESPLFTEKEKSALRVAWKSASVGAEIEDNDVVELKKYWSADEIVEIVTTISLYAYLNRFNTIFNTEIEALPKQYLENIQHKI